MMDLGQFLEIAISRPLIVGFERAIGQKVIFRSTMQ